MHSANAKTRRHIAWARCFLRAFCAGQVCWGLLCVQAAEAGGMRFRRIETCTPAQQAQVQVQTSPCLVELLPLGATSFVLAEGQIEKNSAEALATMASELPKGTTIVLQSLGGDLLGGLLLGQYIRAREFNTYVADEASFGVNGLEDASTLKKCISACAYTFLGGVQRRVAPRAEFGVHQFRSKDKVLDSVQTQKIAATLGKYMDNMGVSRNLLDQALMTEPGKVMLIAEHNRKSWRVETENDQAVTLSRFWHVETSYGGKQLVYQSKKQGSSQAIVTVAFARFEGQLKLLLIVKPDPVQEGSKGWLDYFTQPTDLLLRLNGRNFTLPADTDWMRAGKVNTEGTRQIWYRLSPDALAQLDASSTLALQPLWRLLPQGLDAQTVFLTLGLSQLLQRSF